MLKFLIFLFLPFLTFAQIPLNYYSSATGNADDNLKFELNQIIDNHIEYPYTSASTDVWDILKETDKDPNNSNNVILVYSGVSVNASQEYNSGNGWTREHVWAKSRGDFGTITGPGTDVHALRPLDNATNSTRSNRSFNNCTTCVGVTDSWSNLTGSQTDPNDWSFEPRDEVKGDVARMIFYMAVRYEGLDGYVDLEPTEQMLPQSSIDPTHGVWSTLMDWHRADPVDLWEENRNDIIYYEFQDNRNPFIDHPELAEHLWGSKTGVNWPEETLDVVTIDEDLIHLYPNPASGFINIRGLTENALIEVYDFVGRKIVSQKLNYHQKTIDISQLKGSYLFKITIQNKSIVKRILVN